MPSPTQRWGVLPEARARLASVASLCGPRSLRGERHDQNIRCHRRGRALRRFADGDVAGSQGISGPRGRPRNLSERHGVHPHPAPAWRKSPVEVGPARSPGRDRMPADPHLRLRLRSLHDRRRARHERGAGRVLPAADNTRQAARRCSGRIRRGGPRRLRRGGGPDRGRTCGRHKGPLEARRLHHRARSRRRRRRRQTLDRGRGSSARAL